MSLSLHRASLQRLVARGVRRGQISVSVHASAPGGHARMATTQTQSAGPKNVLGGPLSCCCTSPMTGYYRDGYCRTDESDFGRHVVCAQVTEEFLMYSRSKGNDLMTPAPHYNFPGLKAGDKWWREAHEVGKAPPLFLNCTNMKALEYVPLEVLKKYAVDADEAAPQ